MAPAAPVRAKIPVPPSSTSAVPTSSRRVATTRPPVMATVAFPVPEVLARSPAAWAPDTVTRPVLTTAASPAFPMVVAELDVKNEATTPTAPNHGSLSPTVPPEVSTVPWFSARTEPEVSTVPEPTTRTPAATALEPSPVVVTVAPRSLKVRARLGLSAVPPPHAMATAPSAFQPPVITSPRFRTSAIAEVRLPSFRTSA